MATDAGGYLVLPGIVDLHGDAFERQLMPRPGVHFAPVSALLETDRQLLANGITTAYHGVTLSWEPGLRSIEAARQFLAALTAARPRLGAGTRLHLRFECFSLDTVEEVVGWIEAGQIDLLAFNEHTNDVARDIRRGKLGTYLGRTRRPCECLRIATIHSLASAVHSTNVRLRSNFRRGQCSR